MIEKKCFAHIKTKSSEKQLKQIDARRTGNRSKPPLPGQFDDSGKCHTKPDQTGTINIFLDVSIQTHTRSCELSKGHDPIARKISLPYDK